jgi:hypothetical protein
MILRLASRVALWGLAWLLIAQAWMSTASASAFDSRVPWGLLTCGVALAAGTLGAFLLASWQPDRFARPDANRHGLSLLALGLCAQAGHRCRQGWHAAAGPGQVERTGGAVR